MSKDATKSYQFTIVNGAVTAVYEVKNGYAKYEKMDSNEVWSVDGSNIIKTEYEHGRSETTIFSDIDGDGIFAKMSKSYGTDALVSNSTTSQTIATNSLQNGYQFDVANGNIAAVYEIDRGYKSQEKIDSNETWSINGANIIKTEVEHGITETTTYADVDGDGFFAKVSKTYVTTDGSVWNGNVSGTDNDDQWRGNNSDDHFYAGNGNDRLSGGFGNDVLYGADGDDYLNGGAGVDALTGGIGSDDLYGEDGNDTLMGGAGADDLYGGLGNDTFKYASVNDSGLTIATCDHIYDFSKGDKIDLSAIDAKVGNWTNDAFTFIGNSSNLTLANANGAVWFENGILYGSNDRDTAAEFQIELVGVSVISSTDLIL